MTSIETIKNAIRVLDENIILADDEYKPYIIWERDEYKQVLKDLEVLNILKEAYYHAIWELYHYHKEYYLQDGSDGYRNMEITKEQYDKLKEWLEEE